MCKAIYKAQSNVIVQNNANVQSNIMYKAMFICQEMFICQAMLMCIAVLICNAYNLLISLLSLNLIKINLNQSYIYFHFNSPGIIHSYLCDPHIPQSLSYQQNEGCPHKMEPENTQPVYQ